MAGRGNIGEVPPIINNDCYMLRMGRWQAMHEPINPDRPIFEGEFRSGVCLAASFADTISKNKQIKVGLIPCADGGTKIDQWMPGGLLYDHAVAMAKIAKRTSVLAGIIWHQGESDCDSDDLVESYKDKFIRMISSMRRDLDAEDVPVVIGELSEKADEKWGMKDRPKRLNDIYHQIKNEIPLCSVASAVGLKLKADGLHFDSLSLRTFGNRYALEYEKSVNKTVSVRSFEKLPNESKYIRETVFVREQGFKEEFDSIDNYATHFVAYDFFGRPIGTCRVFTENDASVYYLGRLAVLSGCRGMNVGRELVKSAEQYVISKGGNTVKLHSQCRAMEFYVKCGYSQFGDIDHEECCPHVWMIKELK